MVVLVPWHILNVLNYFSDKLLKWFNFNDLLARFYKNAKIKEKSKIFILIIFVQKPKKSVGLFPLLLIIS